MSTPEFWRAVEAVHSPVYFDSDVTQRLTDLGLRGFWMSYFASRAAALGTPGPELVTATFHGFAPDRVARALPEAWALASREDVLAARLDGARAALTPAVDDLDLTSVNGHLTEIVRRATLAGRPLAAAHAALPAPDDPVGRLWHFATVLREYHGDAHVAVLTASGIDGATANALAVAAGLVPADQQEARGWDDRAWDDAYEQLHMRGWVDESRQITPDGTSARARIEETTHRVANSGIGDREATARAISATPTLVTIARAIEASGAIPYPNPTAVPQP
ncbi:SCO6745 family protein [Aeromicrobium sp. CF3.5]|uniref:SCO6745 family protein n=1 Tax=Aeromicrobium sp. CF3.5 TaxID=3373078 RepID=UPI003EE4E89B